MWLPMTKADWMRASTLHAGMLPSRVIPEREVLKRNADWLLEHLFVPHKDCGAVARTRRLSGSREAINWGNLAASVEAFGDAYIVTLEEATPGQCPMLCAYVGDWLRKWGWTNIRVETEW